jgi:hypothetical protein
MIGANSVSTDLFINSYCHGEMLIFLKFLWKNILPEDGGNMFLRNLCDHLQVVRFHIPDDHKFSKLLGFSQKT